MFSIASLDLPPLAHAGGSVRLPGSKSISNRVLLLAALCQGRTTLHDVLDSDDTRVMLAALAQLGCQIEQEGSQVRILGIDGRPAPGPHSLFLGNAGTAMRPLTAALAVMGGDYTLSGVPRMHQRPIGDLVDALRQLGCEVADLGEPGFPPLRIGKPTLRLQQAIRVRGDVSSQFLTALLMALPLVAQQDVVIEVTTELISKPYIGITLALMARFGVNVQQSGWQRFVVPAGSRYRSPGDLHVEADASSASYFIALGAISTPGAGQSAVRIEGVGMGSIQGDIRFVQAAEQMGAVVRGGPNWLEVSRGSWPLRAIDLDANHIPDAAMTLAVMALFADGPSTLRNIASWRVKETDRISAMACELRKLGAGVEEGEDHLRVTPPALNQWRSASIHTYDDHRVAMCLSLAAFNPAGVPVRILDPQCVAKTYPDYFEDFLALCRTAPQHIPVLCIDGPTASGKGTVAAELARRLGYHFLDSGSLYRITGLAARQAGWEPTVAHEQAIADLAQRMVVRFDHGHVFLNGQDVTEAIRTEEAGMDASKVSALGQVRQVLVGVQHAFRALPGLVADGRDMGTVIFPDARLKVYLTASAAQRAERRHKQLISKGFPSKLADLRADLEARDLRDSTRAVAPLKPAADALLLDNSELTVDETVDRVMVWWQGVWPYAQH